MQTYIPDPEPFIRIAASLHPHGAKGRAGLRALVREIEAKYPGEIERLSAALQLDKLGARCPQRD